MSLKPHYKPVSFIILLAIALLMSGCSSDDKGSSTSSISFTTIYQEILVGQLCVDCHSPGGSPYEDDGVVLDFSSQALAFNTLTTSNVTGVTNTGTCGGIPIVGDTPETSYLAGVLFSDYHQNNFAGVSGCTPYSVHLNDQNLSASEQNLIVGWINAGAPNN